MPTEAEIIANYKAQHDTLSESYYGGISGLTEDEFNLQHGKIWNDMEAELIAKGYIQPPPEPLVFVVDPQGTPDKKRLDTLEEFLKRAYPG